MTIEFIRPPLHPSDRAESASNFLLSPLRGWLGSRVTFSRDLIPISEQTSMAAIRLFKAACFFLALPITALLSVAGLVLAHFSRTYLRSQAHFELQKLQTEGRLESLMTLARENKDPLVRRMAADLDRLKKRDPFDFSIQETCEIQKRVGDYKKFLENRTFAPLYALFKKELALVLKSKLPFRLIEEAKERIRTYQRENTFEEFTYRESRDFLNKIYRFVDPHIEEERVSLGRIDYTAFKQSFLPQLKEKALKAVEDNPSIEERAKILEKIRWVHGTTSAILPFLPATDFQVLPTGLLFDRKIAPMSGELGHSYGGMFAEGITYFGKNNHALSGETLRSLDRSWGYANDSHYLFKPESLEREKVEKALQTTDWCAPRNWNLFNLLILRLRQWDEPLFQKLLSETTLIQTAIKQIETTKDGVVSRFDRLLALFEKEAVPRKEGNKLERLPDPLSKKEFFYGIECVLESEESARRIFSAVEKCRKEAPQLFNQQRKGWADRYKEQIEKANGYWNRIQKAVLVGPAICLNEDSKKAILRPFPILIASSTIIPTSSGSKHEYNTKAAQLGKEIDLLFTTEEHLPELKGWVEKQGVMGKVAVYCCQVFKDFPLPLIHDSARVRI